MHPENSDESNWWISRADMFNMPREERIGARLMIFDQMLYVLRIGPPLYSDIDVSPTPRAIVEFERRSIFHAAPGGDIELTRGLLDVMDLIEKSGGQSLDFIRSNLREFCVFVAAHLNRGSLFEAREDLIRDQFAGRCEEMLPEMQQSRLVFWTYDDRIHSPRLLEHILVFAHWRLEPGRERLLDVG